MRYIYICVFQMQLITVSDVMDHLQLGPNGALIYCMEYLEENFDWLLDKLKALPQNYIIFDCPGQVELYTHHHSMSRIFNKLESLSYHLCTVHLVGMSSFYCNMCTDSKILITHPPPPLRFTLLLRTDQIHISATAVAKHHAADGPASCQCT